MVGWPPLFDIPRANLRFDNWFPDNYHRIIPKCHNRDRSYCFLSEERNQFRKNAQTKFWYYATGGDFVNHWPPAPWDLRKVVYIPDYSWQMIQRFVTVQRLQTSYAICLSHFSSLFLLCLQQKPPPALSCFRQSFFSDFCTAISTSRCPLQHQIISPHGFLITSLHKCLFLSHPSAVWGIPIFELTP